MGQVRAQRPGGLLHILPHTRRYVFVQEMTAVDVCAPGLCYGLINCLMRGDAGCCVLHHLPIWCALGMYKGGYSVLAEVSSG